MIDIEFLKNYYPAEISENKHLSLKNENISYILTSLHKSQYTDGNYKEVQCPHIHVLYKSKKDIPDELQKLFYRKMKELNKES